MPRLEAGVLGFALGMACMLMLVGLAYFLAPPATIDRTVPSRFGLAPTPVAGTGAR